MESTPSKQQQHDIWLKNSGFLYDRLVVEKLSWPSLTFQWLPNVERGQDYVKYEFIYATHTSGQQEIQSLHIAQVTFPTLRNIHESPITTSSTIQHVEQFIHQIEVNKARFYEGDASLIAAKNDSGPITIFKRGTQFPLMLLGDSQAGGFALDWKAYGLVSGDLEGAIRVWKDIEHQGQVLQWKVSVEDTRWIDCNTFGSVGDDGNLCIWDSRSSRVDQVIHVSDDNKQVYTMAINHSNINLLLTGGQDTTIKLWDRRMFNKKIHTFEGHEDSVTNIQWSTVNPTMFASSSPDHKVKIWDLMRVGFQVPRENTGFDELVFTHEGHLGEVTDIGWNYHEMILGSTEQEQNTIQFYQITNNIHDLEYIEDLEYLRQQCLL